ncbi:sigma intracellular receptor 2 [Erythrolamprus reginae]|uniref:sigma intracellular receptor 2 n=1 Tax=Erythrolamprus reginae TaxID=121349 RepID=UPI00396CED9A
MGAERSHRSFPALASSADTDGAMAAARVLEWIFVLYFLTHIPITLFFDLQPLLPGVYPPALSDVLTWYTTTFKDPLMSNPEPWFRSFLYFEAFLQLLFFPVAAYAFWKGNCKWIRTPVIIYGTHVTTTVVACLAHVLFADFSNAKFPSPQTLQERLTLSAIYAPYLAISFGMLLFVLFSSNYKPVEKKKKK